MDHALATPDSTARGFIEAPPDPLRYESCSDAPDEVPDLLARLMPSGVKVLDVGCGTGSATLLVNRGKGNRLFGIEPDGDRAAVAAARGITVATGDFTETALTDHDPFDVIMFADVLEHLADPALILRRAEARLGSAGLILASVPNVAHWTVRLKLLFGRFDYAPSGIMDATHLRWFTTRGLVHLFEREGLEVVSISHSAGTWLPIYARWPLGMIPGRVRHRLVRLLTRAIPKLFGTQIVLAARRRSPG